MVLAVGQAPNDLMRLSDFLLNSDPVAAEQTLVLIEQALRELVISRGRTGYSALYSFEAAQDVALVLALRHCREAGFGSGSAPERS